MEKSVNKFLHGLKEYYISSVSSRDEIFAKSSQCNSLQQSVQLWNLQSLNNEPLFQTERSHLLCQSCVQNAPQKTGKAILAG